MCRNATSSESGKPNSIIASMARSRLSIGRLSSPIARSSWFRSVPFMAGSQTLRDHASKGWGASRILSSCLIAGRGGMVPSPIYSIL